MTTFTHSCKSFHELKTLMRDEHVKKRSERVEAIIKELGVDKGTAVAIEKARRVNSEASN